MRPSVPFHSFQPFQATLLGGVNSSFRLSCCDYVTKKTKNTRFRYSPQGNVEQIRDIGAFAHVFILFQGCYLSKKHILRLTWPLGVLGDLLKHKHYEHIYKSP